MVSRAEPTPGALLGGELQQREAWRIERRGDGAVLVRVPPRTTADPPLPDAVFAFRAGDPQYGYWEQQLRLREGRTS